MPTGFAVAVRFCTTCRAEAGFEQPACIDGHDANCPEWVCVECGAAFMIGFPPPEQPEVHVRSVA